MKIDQFSHVWPSHRLLFYDVGDVIADFNYLI